ncbi:hypothetical protein PanWU01x14_358920 [Parasponia andersonii]|uniref:Uncharacterized protein n=1 Tax=Parasponia andersonii TaxID=3476 RepID=A0A2P5A852_PARAD|nr:hypothetical protein PanWU01x14_358920 [Parasponia andersonii]
MILKSISALGKWNPKASVHEPQIDVEDAEIDIDDPKEPEFYAMMLEVEDNSAMPISVKTILV